MVRLIHDYPVWSASLHAELLETREERGEKGRPIFEGESKQIDYRVLCGLGEELQDFRNAGRPLRIAQHDRFRGILVVPFRVNNTKLIPVLSQALQEARGEGRLTAPGGTGEEHVDPVWIHPHLRAALLGTEHDVMACEPGL